MEKGIGHQRVEKQDCPQDRHPDHERRPDAQNRQFDIERPVREMTGKRLPSGNPGY